MRQLLALATLGLVAACTPEAPVAPGGGPQLLIGNSPLSPLEVEYVKTETGPGTAQWTGAVKGDVAGTLRTRVLSVREAGHIWHIETLWEVDAGEESFDAELNGTLDTKSGALLLTGQIVRGMLVGALVYDTGRLTGIDPVTGGTVFEGSIRIMTGSGN